MNLISRLTLLAILAAVMTPDLAFAQRGRRQGFQRYPVPVGAVHPDFKLPGVDDGKAISLSDYRGKKTLLVHFASW